MFILESLLEILSVLAKVIRMLAATSILLGIWIEPPPFGLVMGLKRPFLLCYGTAREA
jgi:hypothetical protein